MNRAFWKDRPVLITGITGFVGSSLANRLVELGASVVGLVRDEVAQSNFNYSGLRKRITVVHGCLEDLPLLERTVNEYGIEVVYHLGAQTIVGTANRSPISTFKANMEGTWNLLEACRGKASLRALVLASSDKAYGSQKRLPYREDFPLHAQYPYDVSKACADLIAQSYFLTYGLPVVITRFANLYGPGDVNFSRIIPDTSRRVLNGKPPEIRSDGTLERDYLYIDDALDLYFLVAERIDRTKGEAFNGGNSKPVSVLQLVQTILRVARKTRLKPKILGKGGLPGEIPRQWLDSSKAKRLLGWEPKVKLEVGLRKTLAWHRKALSR